MSRSSQPRTSESAANAASVLVLPTLLVLWTRWFGPDVAGSGAEAAAAASGSAEAVDDD